MSPSVAASLIFLVVPLTLVQRMGAADSSTAYNPVYKDCRPMSGNSSVVSGGGGGDLYQVNLRHFLATLPSDTIKNSGFFNGTEGWSTGGTVFGMAMCLADIPLKEQCKSCLEAASADAPTACRSSNNAFICYQGCVLRYADAPILAMPDNSEDDIVFSETAYYTVTNFARVADNATFGQTRKDLFSELARKAVTSPFMIASGNRSFNGTHNLYGLAQCYRKTPVEECSHWIKSAVEAIPAAMGDYRQWSEGLSLAMWGAYIRYDLTQFGVYVPATDSDHTVTTNGGSTLLAQKVATPIFAILIVLLLMLTYGHYQNKWKIARIQKVTGIEEFSYGVIKAAIGNLRTPIGEGGFGKVYKGTFKVKKENKELAVKCIKDHSARKQFLDELMTLAELKHTNVVPLAGFCDNDGWFWFGRRGRGLYICTEYISGGSLDKYIFGTSASLSGNTDGPLDWPVRCRIMRGICLGLQYLHGLCNNTNTIAHLDLKPSNILLDQKKEPKIADFGLSRNLMDAKSHTYTYRTMGTFGYMAPEFTQSDKVKNKYKVGRSCDIYSLGVLILAVVMGKVPEDTADPNGRNFIGEISDKFSAENRNKLRAEGGHEENRMQLQREASLRHGDRVEDVETCIDLALRCVDKLPKNRPPLEDILSQLPNPDGRRAQPLPEGSSRLPDPGGRPRVSHMTSELEEEIKPLVLE